MTKPRVGILDGGLHHRCVFGSGSPAFVLPTRSSAIRPERFDILIIPYHTDQVFLAERRGELESFVDQGGVLLVLGACDLANSDWIPFCQWDPGFTKKTIINSLSPLARRAFAGIRSVKFHTHWHAHGALRPMLPGATEVLAVGEKKRPVMLVVRTKGGGGAIVTTLDPDHHCSPAVPGGMTKTTARAQQSAQHLLTNLLALSSELLPPRNRRSGWRVSDPRKIFLSHKGEDKDLVRRHKGLLTEIGYDVWLDEDVLTAGRELERGLLKGMQESCAAVFFVTPAFKDKKWLAKEIDYAIAEKNDREDGFALVTLSFADGRGRRSEVPELLKNRFVYKEPNSDLEALREIIRAVPVMPGPIVWR